MAMAMTDESTDRRLRRKMVDSQIRARGIREPALLAAMLAVPRHEFVPTAALADAYADRALPSEQGQTISQPYVVALMTQMLRVEPGMRVLEVGTGTGYQAAILAQMGMSVVSIEMSPLLNARARERLDELGYG